MTQLLISHDPADVNCADSLQKALEAAGYEVWNESQDLIGGSIAYRSSLETGILGSVAVVVVWSAAAAQSEWVERAGLNAQRLRRPMFVIRLDDTALPATWVDVAVIEARAGCSEAAADIVAQLPPPGSDEVLEPLLQAFSHNYIRERRAGIEQAAELLRQGVEGERREEILALLEEIAQRDLIMGLREAAQAVLDEEATREQPAGTTAGSRHIFGVRCANHHVCYYDRRVVCAPGSEFYAGSVRRAEVEVNELVLPCCQCDLRTKAVVDCEGYR